MSEKNGSTKTQAGQPRRAGGTLIIIGGHEDKEGERVILKEVARQLGGGPLAVTTVASHAPEGYYDAYVRAFADLEVELTDELYVTDRAETLQPGKLRSLERARGVFFSGGDQLRITSQIGDTPVERRIREIYEAGGVICGTSAGASAMCETMLVYGRSDTSHRAGDLNMAPGLGLIGGVIIDQHFAERGRMGRLLGAVAQNPRVLGIGIDEDTAIVVQGRAFRVIGSGAVYVVDGSEISHSNIAEARQSEVFSVFDARLHVLSSGQGFDLTTRRPRPATQEQDNGACAESEAQTA
ncbi:cyanophycinase (plasmid) [Deinococcus sp. KNUC1210]|uniref:cyanophycinase n=1 Tax=Deinococcus sp. KNUC1210 TaxID=2917691 RepID=UPI001EF14585|nr:cyanophycinase [Deinococcus sp. KNUC1210]ULH17651.1 cyanophycinase [Deinococcus sp. KNUC1210]